MKSGFLLVDKPGCMTSHDVVNRVRRLTGIKRIGHTGTLDPGATGLLVLAIGEATKLISYLGNEDKTYVARIVFGRETDTDDTSGQTVVEKDYAHVDEDGFLSACADLTGTYAQLPPMYSARKVNGKKLYEYAREGKTAEVTPREITIHAIVPVALQDLPNTADIIVRCSKGTYIRSLARDLGRALNTAACMGELRRTSAGSFGLTDAVSLAELTMDPTCLQTHLISPEAALPELLAIHANEHGRHFLKNGNPLYSNSTEEDLYTFTPGARFRLYDGKRFAGIGELREDQTGRYVKTLRLLAGEHHD